MEAAGLAIGVAPLLLELFKQTIEAYKLFIEGKNLEKSMEHLGVRLDIEERRLLQWGESSGFCQSSARASTFSREMSLFRNTALLEIIEKVLRCIIETFSDLAGLEKKYGLDIPIRSDSARFDRATEQTKGPHIEGRQTMACKKRKTAETFSVRKKAKAAFTRFQWAVKDKEHFEKFVADLRYYNDSLYSLHPPDIGASITRDTLASLIQGANLETLRSMGTLIASEPKTSISGGDHASLHPNVQPSAAIALAQRASQTLRQGCVPRAGFLKIPWHQIKLYPTVYDEGLTWATWQGLATAESPRTTNIILEETLSWQLTDPKFLSENMEKTQRLAALLSHASLEPAFQTLEFLGIVEQYDVEEHKDGDGRIALAYKGPSGADPRERPISLEFLMQTRLRGGLDLHVALDDRLTIARSLLHATFQLHSSDWMHKHLTSACVYFFQSQRHNQPFENAWIRHPYIHGFTPHSQIGYTQREGFSMSGEYNLDAFYSNVGQHPSYLFHKVLVTLPRYKEQSCPGSTFYRFRHDYYSLGLIMLELGMWVPLTGSLSRVINKTLPPEHLAMRRRWKPTSICSLVDSLSPWEPVPSEKLENWMIESLTRTTSCTPPPHGKHDLEYEEAAALLQCVRDVQLSINEEKLQDIASFAKLDDDAENEEAVVDSTLAEEDYTFWDLWVRSEIYLHGLYRREAIRLAETSLASKMGRRYQQIVLRCLRSDFNVPDTAGEADWLKAFNWLAVNEIDKLCF